MSVKSDARYGGHVVSGFSQSVVVSRGTVVTVRPEEPVEKSL